MNRKGPYNINERLIAQNLGDVAGTAATEDVQTSPTDTTAGALMAVGAFGLGGNNTTLGISAAGIPINQSSNDKYCLLVKYAAGGGSVQGHILGKRDDSSSAGNNFAIMEINISSSDNSLPTISYSYIGNRNTRLVICEYLGEEWVAVEAESSGTQREFNSARFFGNTGSATFNWRSEEDITNVVIAPTGGTFKFNNNELYHTGNILGTVSQSGGVPTGAVFEKGSVTSGGRTLYFHKHADGKLSVWWREPLDIVGTEADNFVYVSGSITLPVTLSARETATITVSIDARSNSWSVVEERGRHEVMARINTTTQVEVLVYRQLAGADTVGIAEVQIEGRWY